MSETFRGKVLIDLQQQETAWGRAHLPMHVPLVPIFNIQNNDIPSLANRLKYELSDIKSFTAIVEEETVSRSILRRLAAPVLMRLHIDSLRAVRPFTHIENIQEIGDWYDPLIQTQHPNQYIGTKDVIVDEVMLAIETPLLNGRKTWQRTPIILGVPHD